LDHLLGSDPSGLQRSGSLNRRDTIARATYLRRGLIEQLLFSAVLHPQDFEGVTIQKEYALAEAFSEP
jgi:hypothetical protein